jgi:glycosyltransferase involved in cell wall biosynthesis
MTHAMSAGRQPDAAAEQPTSTARLKANFDWFAREADASEAHLQRGHLEEAALAAAIAATFAAKKHCGIFASERLERVLRAISQTLPDRAPIFQRARSAKEVGRILHIATDLSPVGGLTRLISRWVNTDTSRINSVALTRSRGLIPKHLVEAVSCSGGKLHKLNTRIGSALDWALYLRKIARQHDLVVLHIHCEDTIPVIAFGPSETLPPVLLLNHADHLFWLGSSISHAVLNLREAAADIAIQRRGIAPERSLMLPTLIDPPNRRLSREEARATLGVEDDCTLLISVARGIKYHSINGVSYASRFVDVLRANPKAKLIVVGSGSPDDWKSAQIDAAGQIVGLPEQSDPSNYFEAADIYVDSYPFSSSTSLMEAAGYGLPLLTLFTAPDEARLVGINHLGLIDGVVQARSTSEWEDALGRMIREPAFRLERSSAASKAVAIAQPTQWRNWLEAAYQRAIDLPPLPPLSSVMPGAPDTPHFGEPDCRHEDMYGSSTNLGEFAKDQMGALTLSTRLKVWRAFLRDGTIRGGSEALRLLMPEWLKRRLKRAPPA